MFREDNIEEDDFGAKVVGPDLFSRDKIEDHIQKKRELNKKLQTDSEFEKKYREDLAKKSKLSTEKLKKSVSRTDELINKINNMSKIRDDGEWTSIEKNEDACACEEECPCDGSCSDSCSDCFNLDQIVKSELTKEKHDSKIYINTITIQNLHLHL